MAIMRKLMARKQKEMHFPADWSPPRYSRLPTEEDLNGRARKGFVPVLVGGGEGVRERFWIPTHFMSHPVMVSMLESSAEEFGFRQEGVLKVVAEPGYFREIMRSLE